MRTTGPGMPDNRRVISLAFPYIWLRCAVWCFMAWWRLICVFFRQFLRPDRSYLKSFRSLTTRSALLALWMTLAVRQERAPSHTRTLELDCRKLYSSLARWLRRRTVVLQADGFYTTATYENDPSRCCFKFSSTAERTYREYPRQPCLSAACWPRTRSDMPCTGASTPRHGQEMMSMPRAPSSLGGGGEGEVWVGGIWGHIRHSPCMPYRSWLCLRTPAQTNDCIPCRFR